MVWEWFGRGVERKRGFWARETHELGGGGRLLLLLLLLLLRPAPFEAEDDDEEDGREREDTGARRRHRCVRGYRPRARGGGAHARGGGAAAGLRRLGANVRRAGVVHGENEPHGVARRPIGHRRGCERAEGGIFATAEGLVNTLLTCIPYPVQ